MDDLIGFLFFTSDSLAFSSPSVLRGKPHCRCDSIGQRCAVLLLRIVDLSDARRESRSSDVRACAGYLFET